MFKKLNKSVFAGSQEGEGQAETVFETSAAIAESVPFIFAVKFFVGLGKGDFNEEKPQPVPAVDTLGVRCRVSGSLLPASKNGHLNTDTFCCKTAS